MFSFIVKGDDPIDIVKEKCRAAVKIVKKPTLVEDTCLCFNALNGLPGNSEKVYEQKLIYDNRKHSVIDHSSPIFHQQHHMHFRHVWFRKDTDDLANRPK